MKNGIICLMATLLFSINGLNAQCLQGKQSNQLRLYESTGVGKLDQLLNAEKRLLEEFFKVKTELKILNDSDAPNAYATDKSSNTFYFDGTVYLGYRADNFYIIKGECWNVDDAGNKARVGAVELSSNDKAREWLTYLNW
jgi:hypothetical protein